MNLNAIPSRPVDVEMIQLQAGNRHTINQSHLQELASSMREHGLINPILLRPDAEKADVYYVIAGERRLRAAQLINWETIPARVLPPEVADDELKALRLVENLQREDLSPWEEADQLSRLRELDPDARVEDLANTVGKSATWVAQRLAFHRLIPGLKTLVKEQHWPVSHLPLLARVSVETQVDLLQEIQKEQEAGYDAWTEWDAKSKKYKPVAPSLNELKDLVDEFQRVLSTANWNRQDAKLLPAAGSCMKCPKRSLAQALLFPEVKDSKQDRCLDVKCWEAKQAALVALSVDKLKAKQVVLIKDYREPSAGVVAQLGDLVSTIRNASDFNECKQGEKGARPAVLVSGPETGKVTYVKQWRSEKTETMPSRRAIDQETGKPKPPSTKERLAALLAKRMCTAVEFWRDETLVEIKPHLVQLVAIVACVGVRHPKMHRDGDHWKQCGYWRNYAVDTAVEQKLIGEVWPSVVPVLQERLKRFTPFEDAAKGLWEEVSYQVTALYATEQFKVCWESAVAEVKFPSILAKEGVEDPYGVDAMPSIALPVAKKGKGAA